MVGFAFVSLVIYAADRRLARGFFDLVQTTPYGDKVGHFALIGGLAFLLNRALASRSVWPGLQLGGVLIAVFVVIEEISQQWIPSRTFDWWDLAADFVGIAAADWLARRFIASGKSALPSPGSK